MKVRSRAPLRLGLAGGGTDLSPYCDEYEGAVLNATINLFVHAYVDDEVDTDNVIFTSMDMGVSEELLLDKEIQLTGKLVLHRAVYKRIMDDYNQGVYIPMKIVTHSDAPAGSGLGGSSTVVVAIIEALRQLLSIPLGEYEIERNDCNLSGGRQDQYAAAFGGFNFIEFSSNDKVIVNPLRIRRHIMNELECSMIMFFLGTSRSSANIIEDQINTVKIGGYEKLNALHKVKRSAYRIKECLYLGDIFNLAAEFKLSWEAKKDTSRLISNKNIDELERRLYSVGAWAFKVSGAGGGGFSIILIEPEKRAEVLKILKTHKGYVQHFQFYGEGVHSWTV
jgi:D-glycero-alpha-D-manno-heptose-7-phosphate kinase